MMRSGFFSQDGSQKMSEQPSGRPTELTGCFTLANGVEKDQDEARVSVPQLAGCECLHKIGGRLSSRVIAVQKGGHRRCGAHADWRSERQGQQEGKRRQGWQRRNRLRHAHAGRKREDAKKSSEKNKNKTRFYCERQGYSKSDCRTRQRHISSVSTEQCRVVVLTFLEGNKVRSLLE